MYSPPPSYFSYMLSLPPHLEHVRFTPFTFLNLSAPPRSPLNWNVGKRKEGCNGDVRGQGGMDTSLDFWKRCDPFPLLSLMLSRRGHVTVPLELARRRACHILNIFLHCDCLLFVLIAPLPCHTLPLFLSHISIYTLPQTWQLGCISNFQW